MQKRQFCQNFQTIKGGTLINLWSVSERRGATRRVAGRVGAERRWEDDAAQRAHVPGAGVGLPRTQRLHRERRQDRLTFGLRAAGRSLRGCPYRA